MKSAALSCVALVVILPAGSYSLGAAADKAIPEFEFDVWASPPSREIYALSSEPVVQRILYTIEEKALSADEIAAAIESPPQQIREKLNALAQLGLARKDGSLWISCIPMYTEDELRAAEEIGKAYAEKQAAILREELPRLQSVFRRTLLARYFSWEEVSLIVVGALLSDFCVVDRVPFMAEHYTQELQPPLVSPSGKRWAYDGFQKLPQRFPSRKWKFYQNVASKYSGALTRFGYITENRADQPSRPEGWIRFEQGKILFALAEGPQTLASLKAQTALQPEILKKGLDALERTSPPAVVLENGKYRSRVPILCHADLAVLLPECDRVAERIFEQVVRPHHAERVARGKAAGSRWPLPADTYVRDKALQMLSEDGQISAVSSPPVDWSFGFWGWKGLLAMHDQITENVKPDPFLLTPVSDSERNEIARLNHLQDRILAGESLADVSTPAYAHLTRISAYAHSDLAALRQVEVPAEQIDMAHLENLRKRGWVDYIGSVNFRRLPPAPARPADGDVCPVFTMHERGYEEAYVFFFYDGGWRFLGSTSKDGFWHTWAQDAAQEKVQSLTKK